MAAAATDAVAAAACCHWPVRCDAHAGAAGGAAAARLACHCTCRHCALTACPAQRHMCHGPFLTKTVLTAACNVALTHQHARQALFRQRNCDNPDDARAYLEVARIDARCWPRRRWHSCYRTCASAAYAWLTAVALGGRRLRARTLGPQQRFIVHFGLRLAITHTATMCADVIHARRCWPRLR